MKQFQGFVKCSLVCFISDTSRAMISDESESGEEDEEDSDDEFSGSEEGSSANDSNPGSLGATKVGVKRVPASDSTRRVFKRHKGGRRS